MTFEEELGSEGDYGVCDSNSASASDKREMSASCEANATDSYFLVIPFLSSWLRR